MNQDIKARWLEALRSGRYARGTERLQADGKFCCLGVLCELAVADGIAEADHTSVERYGHVTYQAKSEGNASVLPGGVVAWAELPSENPLVGSGDDRYSVAHFNDHGYSFGEIADLIERWL